MAESETPKANPELLLALVHDAYAGKVVLPEFQRSFVWTREQVEELLISILNGYFIGTFLIIDTDSSSPIFPYRLVDGIESINDNASSKNHTTIRLVLDGQQRLTSVVYALYEPKIPLKTAKNPYRFYLRLEPLLEGKTEEAVEGVSLADRRRLSEFDGLVKDYKAIPFSLLLDPNTFYKWLYSQQTFLRSDTQKDTVASIFRRFQNFMVPVVSLPRETNKGNIVNIFEKINSTGTPLSLFDLAVAQLYTKGIKLRRLWNDFIKQNREAKDYVDNDFPLKVIALLDGRETKRGILLEIVEKMAAERFKELWDTAVASLEEALRRLKSTQGGYGAFSKKWVPYKTLLAPLAALIAEIKKIKGGAAAYSKLDVWYWASVLTARYDSAVDSTTYRDFKDICTWIKGGPAPTWIQNIPTVLEDMDLKGVDEQRSAIYRGLMCLVVLKGAKDFINGQAADITECQVDHIFPRDVFGNHPHVDSILNKTLISSNQDKGAKKPSEYLPSILEKHGSDESNVKETFSTHLISETAYEAMWRDDFDTFLEERRKTFLEEIMRRLSQ